MRLSGSLCGPRDGQYGLEGADRSDPGEGPRARLQQMHMPAAPRALRGQLVPVGLGRAGETEGTGQFLLLHMPQLVTFDMLVEREAALAAAGAQGRKTNLLNT